MFDCERRKMYVWHEVRLHPGGIQERTENLAVSFCGFGNPRYFTIEPRFDLFPSFRHRLGEFKNARIGDNAEKRQQAGPWQAHPRIPVEFRI